MEVFQIICRCLRITGLTKSKRFISQPFRVCCQIPRQTFRTFYSFHVIKTNHQLLRLNQQELVWQRWFSDYPDHIIIKLPALSPTMEVGNIASWSVKEGDQVKEGDALAETETDKATMVIESPEDGYVAKLLYPVGAKDLKVGEPILILTASKEDVPKFKDYKVPDSEKPSGAPGAPAPAPPLAARPAETKSGPPEAPAAKERQRESPMAKNLGKSKKDLFGSSKLPEEESVQRKPAAKPPQPSTPPPAAKRPSGTPGGYVDIPLSNIRKVIANRLLQSKTEMPHYYVTVDIVVEELEKIRYILNSELVAMGIKLSMNDFVIKATALACKAVPKVNASWMGTFIREYENVDVSVAVSTPGGLLTPIVFNADQKPLREISQNMKDLAARARQGQLKPQEFQGGTITVSNLGMMGVNQFCAIINPPQSAILAIGTTQKKLYLKDPKKGIAGEKSIITVTLSADHRIVDGAMAATWLQAFKDFMESPKKMFA